jgi:uncharacterized membrane protein
MRWLILLPFIGIPIGYSIIKLPMLALIIGAIFGVTSIAMIIVGLVVILLKGSKTSTNYATYTSNSDTRDAMNALKEEYRHRNAQDGKY